MGNFLQQLLGMSEPVDSAGQLEQMKARRYSPALERTARAKGFRNAAQMDDYIRQRNTPKGGTIGKGTQAPASLDTFMSWHPKNIFEKILGRWQGATGD